MSPSAPTATAADGERLDELALAGGVRRVDEHGQVGQVVHQRHRREVERVAGRRLERPDPALAQDDCEFPGRAMYSAAISHSSIVAPKPRLSITGRLDRPQASRSEKFCMLRVPIWRMSAYSATMSTWLGSMHLGDHRHAGPLARLGEVAEALDAQALEAVRAGARLERAAADDRRAVRPPRTRPSRAAGPGSRPSRARPSPSASRRRSPCRAPGSRCPRGGTRATPACTA